MDDSPNIIFLTIDALRADHCSWLGYDRETTPNLDAFAESGIDCRSCSSVSSHTREAMPSLLSGYRPSRFAANGFKPTTDPLLAERLSEAGYATGGFHSNPYLSRAYGFDRGFDEFYDDLLLGRNRFFALAQRALEKFVFKRGEYYARADEINRRSIDWLDSTGDDRSVFLWNHYMDVHGPYHASERYWADRSLSASDAESLYRRAWKDPEGVSEQEQQLLVDSYDDEIRGVDGQIGEFLHELRNRELLEDSLVIITADHGDGFGEHGYFAHPRYLHESLLHVPLLISPPGMETDTIETPVSVLDIVPSVLEYAGVDTSNVGGTPWYTGSDVSFDDHEGTVFASATGEDKDAGTRRFAVRNHRRKVVLERDIETGEILSETAFDLVDDPDETDPRDIETTDVTELRNQLIAFSPTHTSAKTSEETTEPSAEIEDRLEALGYK